MTLFQKYLSQRRLHFLLLFCLLLFQLLFLFSLQIKGFGVILLGVLLLVGMKKIYDHDLEKLKSRFETEKSEAIKFFSFSSLLSVIFSVLGGVFAYFVCYLQSLHSLAILCLGVFLTATLLKSHQSTSIKNLEFPFYAGVFVGASPLFKHDFGFSQMLLSASCCGLLFVLFKNSLIGTGGRLGTFAFISVYLTWLFI